MKFILRIFKYARQRIIALSIQNKILKMQIKALIESNKNTKQ